MKSFLQRFGNHVLGVLSGFDRLRFRGTKRFLANAKGMMNYLWQVGVRIRDFREYALERTGQLQRATEALCREQGRPLKYLNSSNLSKEEEALALAERDDVKSGLIGVFSCVEPCQSYDTFFNQTTGRWELRSRPRRCLHYYHYYRDPQLGLMHIRLQSWFPFTMYIGMNGRHWLAQQLDTAKIHYQKRENCLIGVDDFARTQALLEEQVNTDWPLLLGSLATRANPVEATMLSQPAPYYWSLESSEWATDLVFASRPALAALYPTLVHHAMKHMSCRDVLRYLGRKAPFGPDRYGTFAGEVISDYKERYEGVRVKHWVNANSIKMYDKQARVLRVETTLNQPGEFKVWRSAEGDPQGPRDWRPLRKGVADLQRRAEVCQRANERYLENLSTTADTTPLRQWAEPLCKPAQWQGRRVRALNPLGEQDAALLVAVNRGEFALAGFRNKDLRGILYPSSAKTSPAQQRQQSAAVTRLLRLLRGHGLIKKVNKTHRYLLTERGRHAIPALLAARQADTAKLHQAA